MNQCSEDHFRWIGIMADRIICSQKQENELPLLSLSFLKNNDILNFFSQFSRPSFPITTEKLSDAKLYGIIVSAIAHNKGPNIQYLYNFDLILNKLQEEGYVPQQPCNKAGLENGDLTHHVNLCKSIEFFVVDRSLNIHLLTSDLNYLPHSFYVLKSDTQIFHLEDAISLWLSKFHCIADFAEEPEKINHEKSDNVDINDKIYSIQMDASKFSKIAACLSRAFPEKIDKDAILNGDDEDDVQYNIKLAKSILGKMNAFIIEKFPTDEHLFTLFISDLYWATRSAVNKFVVFDHPILEPHLPGENGQLRSPRRNRRELSKKINLSYFLSGPIDAIEGRKECEEGDMDEAKEEEKYNIITPYSSLQNIKDDEESNITEAREEEKYNIITPYTSLQNIKDGEESNITEAREEEKYSIITPYNTLQDIKDDEESNIVEAKEEEKYNIITPYNTLQDIKDDEESNVVEAKEEEKYNIITPYNTLQDIKDDEESNVVEATDEEKYNIITPYSSLQKIKDGEESNIDEAREEEKYSIITPYNTLQDIKDDEEGKLKNQMKEFSGLLDMSSSNRQRMRKIIRPIVEPKGVKN